eukprot:477438-Rhodomonas_salina.2
MKGGQVQTPLALKGGRGSGSGSGGRRREVCCVQKKGGAIHVRILYVQQRRGLDPSTTARVDLIHHWHPCETTERMTERGRIASSLRTSSGLIGRA